MPNTYDEWVRLTFDTGTQQWQREGNWRGFGQALQTLGPEAQLATQAKIAALAEDLRNKIEDIWTEHGHNRTGASLQTLKVEMRGMGAEVKMGGGGPFIEYGWPGHVIPGNPLLVWDEDDGSVGAAPEVWSPAYAGDPFIEQAMDEIDFDTVLADIAVKTFSKIEYGMGETVLGEGGWTGQFSGEDQVVQNMLSEGI